MLLPISTADTFRAGAYGSNVTAVLLPKVERDALSRVPRDPADEFCQAMQAQVRGTCGSLIDFQFSKHGVLTSFYEKTDYYRTLIEWRAGDEGIGHLDQHFFPLTTRHTSPPRIVLAARRPGVTRAEALNRWTDAYDHEIGRAHV